MDELLQLRSLFGNIEDFLEASKKVPIKPYILRLGYASLLKEVISELERIKYSYPLAYKTYLSRTEETLQYVNERCKD